MAAIVGSSPATMDISIKSIPAMFRQFAKTFSEEPQTRRDGVDETIKKLARTVMTRYPSHQELNDLLNSFDNTIKASKSLEIISREKAAIVLNMATCIEKVLGTDHPKVTESTVGGARPKAKRGSIIELPLFSAPSQESSKDRVGELTRENAELRQRVESLVEQQNKINASFETDMDQLRTEIARLSSLVSQLVAAAPAKKGTETTTS